MTDKTSKTESRKLYKINWNRENLDKIKEYNKFYYKNKSKSRERLLEKITCECGMKICRGSLRRHLLSNHHKSNS